MKVEKLEIKNIGLIGDEIITFNKSLNLFYGDVRQGKTTILNAIKLVFGGKFPDDIIKHGEKRASISLYFDKTYIKRKFRKDSKGITKADKIEFVDEDGVLSEKPVDAIKKFLNPFLLNQNHLSDMNAPDRKRFFVEVFGVDTQTIDVKLTDLEATTKTLRSTIKAYGEISNEKVESANVDGLKKEKAFLVKIYEKEHDEAYARNETKRKRNDEIARCVKRVAELLIEVEGLKVWLESNKTQELEEAPMLETEEIDIKINEAVAQNVKYEQYLEDQGRRSLKAQDQDELTEKVAEVKELREERATLLSEINDKCVIKNLFFDKNGDFEFEHTTAEMLSTSQLMRLSGELGKLYPQGFGIELIDRGESLGKDIFGLIDRAIAEETTILATVVGEKPADVPEEIGVFVVESGTIN